VLLLIEQGQDWLRQRLPRGPVKLIDAKPLPIGGCSKDRDARYGRCAGGKARGYRIHLVQDACRDACGAIERWTLAPMNANEKPIARIELLPRLPHGTLYVAADNEYDGNGVFDTAMAVEHGQGTQLIVAPRKIRPTAVGHRPQSPARLRSLALTDNPMKHSGVPSSFGQNVLRMREGIERSLALMGNFGGGLSPLPNWVRRPRRVALWVAGKILIHTARLVVKQRLAA